MNLRREVHPTVPVLRLRQANAERRSQTRAARTARASQAWSCSNPDHDDLMTSKASNYSTASPAQALPYLHHSQTHMR
jgi:hypothetical protein